MLPGIGGRRAEPNRRTEQFHPELADYFCLFFCCGAWVSSIVSSAHCSFHGAHRLFPMRL
jgi:hypothetical protein